MKVITPDEMRLLRPDQVMNVLRSSLPSMWVLGEVCDLSRCTDADVSFKLLHTSPSKKVRFSFYPTDHCVEVIKARPGYVIHVAPITDKSIGRNLQHLPTGLRRSWRQLATILSGGVMFNLEANVLKPDLDTAIVFGVNPEIWPPHVAAAMAVLSFVYPLKYPALEGVELCPETPWGKRLGKLL